MRGENIELTDADWSAVSRAGLRLGERICVDLDDKYVNALAAPDADNTWFVFEATDVETDQPVALSRSDEDRIRRALTERWRRENED